MKGIAKRFNRPQSPPHFDESELKTNLGAGNFIFVGSSCDLFAKDIPEKWMLKTLKHCEKFDNRYLLQSKNPRRILDYMHARIISQKSVFCTTIETNRYYPDIMKNCPHVYERAETMSRISEVVKTFVTIEPVMDFDLWEMVRMIAPCHPEQVNIGADTGHNHLPEPPKEKILELIAALSEFTTVKQKINLSRLLKNK
jgi:hypothetical protein